MSATGRSDVRQESDLYVTPPWTVHRFLETYELPQGATVLDPCAANGELLAAIHDVRPDLKLIAIELRPECEEALQALEARGVIQAWAIGDFTALALESQSVDAIVTNPPYALAQSFVQAGIRVAKICAYLLRLNFLGGKKRATFTQEVRPGLFISPNRPSFTGWGSDACEYAWMLYNDAAWAGSWAMLGLTPDEVIEDWNESARKRYPHLNPKLVKARKEAAKKAAAEAAAETAGDISSR